MFTGKQKKVLVILAAFVVVLILAGLWNLFVSKKLLGPRPAEEGAIELSPEVLESLTPPPGAEPLELSPEVLESLTPPEGAEPIELSPEVLESLTP